MVVDATDQVDMYDVNDSVVQQVHYGKRADEDGKDLAFNLDDKEHFGDLVNPTIKNEAPQVGTLTQIVIPCAT